MSIKDSVKSITGFIILGFMFIAASYVVHVNSDFFTSYIRNDTKSMLLYILILIVSAVFAPVDIIFLMPLATTTWGWMLAGLLSLIGWTLGSAVVFFLSRKVGVPLIYKHFPFQKIYKYEKYMPQKNLFFGIIFLRIAIPIDLISYALGLFTNIQFLPYITATIIGFIPLAFFLAYIGTLPIYMQVLGFILFLFIAGIGYATIRHKIKKEELKKQHRS
ncbi:MAG: VTT domain-containing protein [Candidatus Woesearchaeota archaeon]|nr:VTT domain-containing protein [Candidatus Woesearchaeota archaeon]